MTSRPRHPRRQSPLSPDRPPAPSAWRLATAGMMLAAYSLGLGGLGWVADSYLGWQIPWLGIAGLLIGFAAGFYRLMAMVAGRPGGGGPD